MSSKCYLLLGSAGLLASAGAALAAAPGGGGFGQYGVITSTSIVGQTATPVTLVSGNGFLQQKVTTTQGSFYRTIILDNSATATDAAGVAALGFTNETFTGTVSGSGDTAETADGCNAEHFNPISAVPTPVSNTIGEAVDRSYPHAYVPNGADGTVSVVDTATYQTVATVPVEAAPYGVAIDPRGLRAYISNHASNSVSVIDADTYAVVATVPTGAGPAGLATDREGARLFIALEAENAVSVVDTKTFMEVGRIALGYPPQDIVLSPVASQAYVLSRSAAVISRVDLETMTEVGGIPLAVVDYNQPTAITVSPDGNHLYALLTTPARTVSMLEVIDSATGSIEHQDVFSQPMVDITQNAAGTSLYLIPYAADSCTQALELDAASYIGTRTYPVPAGVVRGEYDGAGFNLIVQDAAALVATRYPAGGNVVNTRTAPTGALPRALGEFIGPMRAPVATPAAAALDFGQMARAASALRTLTVSNTGNLPLKVYRTTLEAPALDCSSDPCDGEPDAAAFAVIDDGCAGNTIAVDAVCTVTLRYSPDTNPVSLGMFRFDTNSAQAGLEVPLRGAAAPVGTATAADNSVDKELPATTSDTGNDSGGGGGGAAGPLDLLLMAFACFGSGLARRRSRRRGVA